ncbi:hypothetical protein ATANTOWER_006250 [Ataeniobius toweri]|uniref:Uncharacterized protein n=1 Tax=Ataeniobius toweri TaxID=208326 RepID=A0ABU7CES0_9TELE|nr:hypothetical protein [Ataeniobius toweri]
MPLILLGNCDLYSRVGLEQTKDSLSGRRIPWPKAAPQNTPHTAHGVHDLTISCGVMPKYTLEQSSTATQSLVCSGTSQKASLSSEKKNQKKHDLSANQVLNYNSSVSRA